MVTKLTRVFPVALLLEYATRGYGLHSHKSVSAYYLALSLPRVPKIKLQDESHISI